MKRMHIHISVENLAQNIVFYRNLFGMAPTVEKPDYAKWMLEDPRINFAISQRGSQPGIDHLGFQVDSDDELDIMRQRLESADAEVVTLAMTSCCYAKSSKHWIQDPNGIAWESFYTLDHIPTFNEATPEAGAGSCNPVFKNRQQTIEHSGCC